MGLTHFPNGVSSFGVPAMGGGESIPFTTGTYFFVDSATGNDANDGLDPDHPFATIDYAVGECTANKGDVIVVMPNHTEVVSNLAAAVGTINLDVAGISLVGLGHGLTRPTITYATTAGADIDVTAEDVYIENIYFDMTGIDAVAAGIDIDEKNCTIKNCEFLMADTAGQAAIAIDVGASSAGCKVLNSKFLAPDAGATAAINISAATSGIEVDNCFFDGAFSNAAIYATSTLLSLNAKITHNYVRNDATNKAGINFGLSGSSEGWCAYNVIAVADSTATGLQATTVGGLGWFENYATGLVAESGAIYPATTYGT